VIPAAAGGANAAAAQPPTETPAEPPKKEPPQPSSPTRTVAYVIGGIGIVGLGVGSYFGLRAMQKNKDSQEFCDENNVCDDRQAVELTEEAKDAAAISNIGFAVGGAALATGIVLFVVSSPGGDESQALRISPRIAKNGGGLTLAGSFR
jgi:serine/threonine-protein kinase